MCFQNATVSTSEHRCEPHATASFYDLLIELNQTVFEHVSGG